ncbi:MAG: hypothetical protein GQ570_12595 [Helicobacteraceae bacterium]|nr:hypothetical protein [Helicobacteraceae bacterium]
MLISAEIFEEILTIARSKGVGISHIEVTQNGKYRLIYTSGYTKNYGSSLELYNNLTHMYKIKLKNSPVDIEKERLQGLAGGSIHTDLHEYQTEQNVKDQYEKKLAREDKRIKNGYVKTA